MQEKKELIVNIDFAIEFLHKHENAMEKYYWIMQQVHHTNILDNIEFQHKFNGFYRVRRNKEWQTNYYSLFEEVKHEDEISFQKILTAIYKKTNRIEASFSSKMLTSINPQMPIWDSIVIHNLGMKAPTGKAEQRIQNCIRLYDQIISFYSMFIQSIEASKYVEVFDSEFPRLASISSLKKIDFLIWGTRPINTVFINGRN